MKVIEIQFAPWDKGYWFNPEDHKLNVADYVIVKTELGVEMGKIVSIKDVDEKKQERPIKPILRKANLTDIEKVEQKNKHQKSDLKNCKQLVVKHELPIKIIGVHYSFDGGRITFAFTASGRIDFRELVKGLTHKFQKSIRLHQIGVRDEAKYKGEIGPCGQVLCCKQFLDKLGQVNSDFAETQQIIHRGGDRLTGVCGRLKCCLKYEQKNYEKLNENLPPINSSLKTPQGKGRVVRWHTLKQTVDVSLDKDPQTVIEVEV